MQEDWCVPRRLEEGTMGRMPEEKVAFPFETAKPCSEQDSDKDLHWSHAGKGGLALTLLEALLRSASSRCRLHWVGR